MGAEAQVVGGGTPKTDRAEYFGGDIPWVTPADLSGYKEKYISAGARNITQDGLNNSGARLMPAGTVLFSSRAPIGYVAIAANPVSTNQGFKSFVLRDGLTSDFVYYYLQYAKKLALELASGTTFQEISGKNAARLPVPVPPLPDQRQIVAEIEKQFTRLDAGVAALRRVQANLKRYRAAVLKAACEGRLVPTEAELAKAEGRTYETGEQLLARILADRRKNWRGRGKYKGPAAPDTASLPRLPAGWAWATVEQLAEVVRGASPRPAGDPRYFGGSVPWITVGPLTADQSPYLSSVPATLNEVGRERSRFIEPHTLLLTNSGATLGVPKISLIGGCINDGVAALQDVEYPLKLYLLYFLHTQTERLRGVNQGAAQPNLNTGIIKAISVSLPPLAEQTRIVAEVERRLSVIEELETAVANNLQRATRLRRSILQRAFTTQPRESTQGATQ
jgi:type I restriction enzyme S subunit